MGRWEQRAPRAAHGATLDRGEHGECEVAGKQGLHAGALAVAHDGDGPGGGICLRLDKGDLEGCLARVVLEQHNAAALAQHAVNVHRRLVAPLNTNLACVWWTVAWLG